MFILTQFQKYDEPMSNEQTFFDETIFTTHTQKILRPKRKYILILIQILIMQEIL